EFTVKGVPAALRIHELEGVGPLRTPLDVSRARGFSRFVGRDEEQAMLEAALGRALAGSGQVVGVVAEPGVGKSRLCHEFAERCRARGIPVHEAHAVAHGMMVPLVPVLEYLRGYFGIAGPEATAEMLRELLGTHPSVAEVARSIGERAAGNPFFVEEIVQALAETGTVVGAKGAYRLAGSAFALALPATVQAALAARIDRLAEREKVVLQTAAVIGKGFPEPVLRRVAALSEADLAAALRALVTAEFIHATALHPEAAYAFKHPLTQEVAYHSQLGDGRARLHAAVAAALQELHSDHLGEYASLIAHHWEAAGMRFEAAR